MKPVYTSERFCLTLFVTRVLSLLSAHSSHSEQSSTTPSWGGCVQGFAPAPYRMRTAQTIEENKSSESREVSKKRPVHQNSLRNLRPYVPGQTGNPGGRPKWKPVTEILIKILEDPKQSDALAKALMRDARKGSIAHAREILDRVEGPLVRQVEANVNVTHELSAGEKLSAANSLEKIAAFSSDSETPLIAEVVEEEKANYRRDEE